MLAVEDDEAVLMAMNKWGGMSVSFPCSLGRTRIVICMNRIGYNLMNRNQSSSSRSNCNWMPINCQCIYTLAICPTALQIANDNFQKVYDDNVMLVTMPEYYTGSEYDDLSCYSEYFSDDLEVDAQDIMDAAQELRDGQDELEADSSDAESLYDAEVEKRARKKARKRRRLKNKAKVLAEFEDAKPVAPTDLENQAPSIRIRRKRKKKPVVNHNSPRQPTAPATKPRLVAPKQPTAPAPRSPRPPPKKPEEPVAKVSEGPVLAYLPSAPSGLHTPLLLFGGRLAARGWLSGSSFLHTYAYKALCSCC